MKKVRMPFDLTEFKKGGYKVETRDGNPVRIVCADLKSKRRTIVGLITDEENTEHVLLWYENGHYHPGVEYYYDLFLVKTEYENGDIVKDCRKDKIFIVKGNAGESHIYDYESSTHNTKYCRPATEEEQKQLLDDLAKPCSIS